MHTCKGGTSTNPDWVGSERHRRALSEANQDRRRAGCSATGGRSGEKPGFTILVSTEKLLVALPPPPAEGRPPHQRVGLRRAPPPSAHLPCLESLLPAGLRRAHPLPSHHGGLRQSHRRARDTASNDSLSLFMYIFRAAMECQSPCWP
jgi:hypothetical protein